jgi:hypothetical protein
MTQSRQFIDQLAAGESSSAKETLENLISTKAFEALDGYKKEISSSIFGGKQEETEEELTMEETEQLDELSKGTLGSYVKKAAKNQADHSFDHGESEHRQYGKPGDDSEADKDLADTERNIANREKGIGRAVKRLVK